MKPPNNMISTVPIPGHRSALTLLLAAFTLSITDRMILSILFPNIKAEFGVSDTQLGLLGGLSFALFYATMGLPIARLADQRSRKWIVIASLLTFSAMTTLSSLSVGFLMLLLLRLGVGIGEAGVNPASHSMLADYFPPHRRAFAMATLMLGASLGVMLGFIWGGFVAERFGWRAALLSVGLPGLALAAAMARWLKEPARGSFETSVPGPAPAILQTARWMWSDLAMRHLVAGSVVMGMVTYGLTQWVPTFLIRTHGLTQSKAGLLMAGVFGILGAVGALASGKLFDHLSQKGYERGMWMIVLVMVVSLPFAVTGFSSDDLKTALIFLIIPGFTSNFFLGPTIAMVQTLSPVPMRAVAAAVKMLCLNLIGLGLGPLIVGGLSDALGAKHGDNALQISLTYFLFVGLWGAVHFGLCARELAKRTKKADLNG
ncbi:MAG: MFS transporter [Pseudomonadota bacterium]